MGKGGRTKTEKKELETFFFGGAIVGGCVGGENMVKRKGVSNLGTKRKKHQPFIGIKPKKVKKR